VRLRASLKFVSTEQIEDVLFGLCMSSERQIKRGQAPSLYTSGVRYRREDPGREDWQTAAETYQMRFGDCVGAPA
jgi:hypothetical protein